MNKVAGVLIAGTAVMAGCAMEGGSMGTNAMGGGVAPMTSPCTGAETQVTINQVSIPASAASGSIRVNPGRANIGSNSAGVRWKFNQGNNYAFTGDGITFKAGSPAGPASAAPSSDLSEYRWCFNATSGPLSWPYTIRFYDTSAPTKIWSCDPIIANFDALTLASLTVACTAGS